MNFNNFMHPRNPYRVKRDFKLLAEEFPSFGRFLKPLSGEKVTIDFNDAEALRELTVTLLKKDFDLNVYLPPNRLIPAVPQRLNYVLWVEDLVSFLDKPPGHIINGIDIGVGSSCIFPLLICRLQSKWKMNGTETDEESLTTAMENVAKNGLQDRISLHHTDDWTSLLSNQDEHFDFLMTNPPFFSSTDNRTDSHHAIEMEEDHEEIFQSSHPKQRLRLSKKSSNVSSIHEAVTEGGEGSFVQDIISKSFNFKDRVTIFTVMLGRKASLVYLKKELKKFGEEHDDLSFTTTDFCQGKTMRWGLAWSFTTDLARVRSNRVTKPGKALTFNPIPKRSYIVYTVYGIINLILDCIINDLKIPHCDIIRNNKNSSEIVVASNNNTWSHQRRKRRQQQRLSHEVTNSTEDDFITDSLPSPPGQQLKRHCDDDTDSDSEDNLSPPQVNLQKRLRDEGCVPALQPTIDDGVSFLLCASIIIKREKGSQLSLTMKTRERSLSPETTHQLFQYLKNRLSE